MKKLALVLLGVLLVPLAVWAVVMAGVTTILRYSIDEGRAHQLRGAALAAPVVADARTLLRGDPLLTPEPGADAAAVLDPLLDWSDTPRGSERVRPPRYSAQDTLSRQVNRGVGWTAHVLDLEPDEATYDLGYMAKLGGYTRWRVPTREVAGKRDLSLRADEFEFDGKLRLLRGLRDGQPEQAAAEVRQLAKLLLRSEHAWATRQGLALLRHERQAFDAYVASGKTPRADWKPWPRPRTDALAALLDGLQGALAPLVPDSVSDAMLTADVPQPLRCMAMEGALLQLAPIRDSGDELAAPALARARRFLAEPSGCALAVGRQRWQSGLLYQLKDDDRDTRAFARWLPGPLTRLLRTKAYLMHFTDDYSFTAARIGETGPSRGPVDSADCLK